MGGPAPCIPGEIVKALMKKATTVKVFLLFLLAFGCITAILVGFAIGHEESHVAHRGRSPHTVSVLQPISPRMPEETRVAPVRIRDAEIPGEFHLQAGRGAAASHLNLGLLA